MNLNATPYEWKWIMAKEQVRPSSPIKHLTRGMQMLLVWVHFRGRCVRIASINASGMLKSQSIFMRWSVWMVPSGAGCILICTIRVDPTMLPMAIG